MQTTRNARWIATGLAAVTALVLVRPTEVSAGATAPDLPGNSTWGAGRTHISSLPFTIDACGSYVLVDCLTGTTGQAGITIDADDVTLDLNGFTLLGVAGSLEGIRGNGERVVVTNGSVVDWGGSGIDLSGAGARIEDVVAYQNGGVGIACRDTAIVRGCIARSNGAEGFYVGEDGARDAVVDSCLAGFNAGAGFRVEGTAGTVTSCVSARNGAGIYTKLGTGWGITGNVVTQSEGHGIDVCSHSVVADNVCYSNGTQSAAANIQLRCGGNHVDGNLVSGADFGIAAVGDAVPPEVVVRNSARFNTVNYSGMIGNDFGPLGTAAAATSSWANISH